MAYERLGPLDHLHVEVDKIEDEKKAPDGRLEAVMDFSFKDGA